MLCSEFFFSSVHTVVWYVCNTLYWSVGSHRPKCNDVQTGRWSVRHPIHSVGTHFQKPPTNRQSPPRTILFWLSLCWTMTLDDDHATFFPAMHEWSAYFSFLSLSLSLLLSLLLSLFLPPVSLCLSLYCFSCFYLQNKFCPWLFCFLFPFFQKLRFFLLRTFSIHQKTTITEEELWAIASSSKREGVNFGKWHQGG